MPRGPKKVDREARPGFLLPSEALARNVRAHRQLRQMTQADLAERMSEFGFEWTAGTVGFVERHERQVAVDEYAALTLCLGRAVGELLDPTGPLGTDEFDLDFPGGVSVDAPRAHEWALGNGPILYGGPITLSDFAGSETTTEEEQ